MRAKAKPDREAAERLPVARVSVDVPLAHLDRPFDYLVPAADDEAAQPGVRVKVRFAGQLVNGFLLERAESSPHGGKLAYLDKVVSPERVLDPEVARLARAVADRYAGNLTDVLRLAVPPRHARVEAQATPDVPPSPTVPAPAPVPDAEALARAPEASPPGPASGVPGSACHPDAVAPGPPSGVSASAPGPPSGVSASVPGPPSGVSASARLPDARDPGPVSGVAGSVRPPEVLALGTVSGGPAPEQVSDVDRAQEALTSGNIPEAPGRSPASEGLPHGHVSDAQDVTPDPDGAAAGGVQRSAGRALIAAGDAGVAEQASRRHAGTDTGVPISSAGSSVPAAGSPTAGSPTSTPPAASPTSTPPAASPTAASPTAASPTAASPTAVSSTPAPTAASPVPAPTAASAASFTAGLPAAASPAPAAPGVAGLVHGWGVYPAGAAYLHALEQGRAARAVWSALPGEDWPARIAEAAAVTVRAGRGVVIVVADARDLERLDRALTKVLGDGRHVALNAAAGPAERYRRFLAASRHRVPVVVGTRAAMFAPVAEIGLVVIWDDGDDLHAEPRAPYPHARDVLLTRAQLAGCAALVGGFARTGEAQLLLETGWAKEIVASRDTLRARSPAIAPTGDDPQLARDPGAVTARLPSLAWQAARGALQAGTPVLVQVPRRGYLPSIACAECRTPARCPHCSGPLGLAGSRSVPACHWCGRAAADYACPACGARRLRASVTGARRTAEELGRAFPGVPVRTSGRDEILDTVPGEAALVVATPGAEPVAEGGYGAVLLLDTWALLSRADLRAAEETMRRWFSAAALARPGPAGGRVVVVADGSLAPVQALLRWDPGWFAARELAERRELGFPPAARMASLTGRAEAIAEFLETARLPEDVELLGPVPAAEDQERLLLRVSRSRAAELARILHEAAAVRSAKKAVLPVRIQVDPAELL